MKCKMLLLPLLAGMTLYVQHVSAKHPTTKIEPPAKNLFFVENAGQITNQYFLRRNDIDFRLSTGNGCTVFISSHGLHYQWASSKNRSSGDMYRMDVNLIGASSSAKIITEDKQQYYERYYSEVNNGTFANSFKKITYKNIYPNIDWTLYISDKQVFKYDFIVHPGGKTSDIQLQYGGATGLYIQQEGSLRAITPMGSVDEQAPLSYAQDGQPVRSRFLLKKDILSFDVDPCKGDLIIDPGITWSTYFGGLGNDQPTAVAADTLGNIYMAGGTLSLNNIATTGAYQYSYGGAASGSYIMGDAFLSRFSSTGDLLWSTYYGGVSEDRGLDVTVDKSTGNLYLAGSTSSNTGIATTGAHQQSLGGNFDAFLAKFDTSGQRIWSTYYGGTSTEGNTYSSIGTTTDRSGNIFLCGETNSTSAIATTGAFKTTKASSNDAFVVKFDSMGVRQWGTYIGGSGLDQARKIVADSLGNIYFTGTTKSVTGLATTGAYQSTYGGVNDAFLGSLTGAGAMRWLTYIGGSGFDDASAIAIGADSRVYITGTTLSTTGLATPNSFQDTLNGDGSVYEDGYLASFQNDGTVNWITYYGGEKSDDGSSLFCSSDNYIYLGGYSNSEGGIATTDGLYSTLNNSSYDAFLAKFDTTGSRLWATYIGGADNDQAMALSGSGKKIFSAGMTNSSNFPVTPGAAQSSFAGGDNDAFLLCLNFCDVPTSPLSIDGDTALCSGKSYWYQTSSDNATGYNWHFPGDWSGTSDSGHIYLTTGMQSGMVSVSAFNACGSSDTSYITTHVSPSPTPHISSNDNVLSSQESYASYQWIKDGLAISGATSATYTYSQVGNYCLVATDSNGCSGTSDTLHLTAVGIAEPSTNVSLISWYPNPVSSFLTIQSSIPIAVSIFNIEGRLIKAGTFKAAATKQVQLDQLSDGIYMLLIYGADGQLIKTGKIIKQQR